MNHQFEILVAGGLDAQNHGIVLQFVERMLEQIQLVIASTVNDALPIEEPARDDTGNGIDSCLVNTATPNGTPDISSSGGRPLH